MLHDDHTPFYERSSCKHLSLGLSPVVKMARTVGDINRMCSPMHYIEESLDENREKIREKKRQLIEAQSSKSPFLIGSIEEVNRRISNLDKHLQSYTELIIESRASEKQTDDESYCPPNTAKLCETQQKKALLDKPSERVKNISKISMHPSKTSVKKDSGKPKFVELHQYPGYDNTELTPLPHDVTALEILTTVTNAQPNLRQGHKSQYRPEFERLFYSAMSQAVLQDAFWWIFLEKWQPNVPYQQKLFNRVAHNYVKLMMYAKHPQYKETFFRDYPSLLSQSVYTAFCCSFPDSYRMFGEEFKEDIVALLYEWVAGLRAAPRIWLLWNLEKLEPPGLKQREKLIKQSKGKSSNTASSMSLDFVELLSGDQMVGSQSTLRPYGSVSSMSSVGPANNKHGKKHYKDKLAANSQSGPTTDMSVIQQVESAQTGSKRELAKNTSSSKTLSQPRQANQQKESLTTIRECDKSENENSAGAAVDSKVSFTRSPNKPLLQSHPIGSIAEFEHGTFNTYGQSPLVAHFLRMKKLQVDAGLHARMRRTEIQHLPPLDAPTYRDLIQDSFKKVKQTEKNYSKLAERDREEHSKFIRKQKQQQAEFKKKETLLLSNRSEVKRISDLIMLELKKDQDSIGTGVSQEIDAALASLQC